MEKITFNEFHIKQPDYPEKYPTDLYYCGIAIKLQTIITNSPGGMKLNPGLVKRMAIALTGYFQDVVSDTGYWRSMVDACRRMYGFSTPFNPEGEDYIDYELNVEDVRFLVWYLIAMIDTTRRDLYPHDALVEGIAQRCFDYLAEQYEDAPEPEGYNQVLGLDFYDPQDHEKIFELGQWLFMHCYLVAPAFALTLSEIVSDPEIGKSDDLTRLQNALDQAMMESPTGPLAFFIPEWLKLIIAGKLPEEGFKSKKEEQKGEENHPVYDKFVSGTGGKEVKYFADYAEMHKFLVDSLGWEDEGIHFPQLKDEKWLVMMVHPKRGMLLARDVARAIADPENPYYDRDYAKKNAFDFLTVRGRCPADLTKYACEHGYLPDAVFPGTDDHEIVERHWDFIMRCYLQLYYRD